MVTTLRCVRPQFQWHQLAYATEIMSIQLHDSNEGLCSSTTNNNGELRNAT